jgi:hypothetical protein
LNHGWLKIEDNLNFLISRLNYQGGNIEVSVEYIENILKTKRSLSNVYENYIIEHYMLCLNKYRDKLSVNPILMLPVFNVEDIRLNLVQTDRANYFEISFRQSDVNMWKNLEEQLYLAHNSKTSSSFSCQKQLFTKFTDNKTVPILCIDDNISICVEVVNNIGVQIVLEEISLLWVFSSTDNSELSNNDRDEENSQFIICNKIDPITLRALEKREIEFNLKPKLEGLIRISGVKYLLEIPTYQTNSKIDNSSVQSEYNKTKGKQLWEIKTNSSKNISTAQRSIHLIPDNRLNIKVVPKLPLIQIEIEDFPENVLCGELICANLNFINLSDAKITNLSVASNFKSDLIFEDELKQNDQIRSGCSSKKDSNLVHKFNKILEPNETFKTRVWIQTSQSIESKIIHFMFYYSSQTLAQNSLR